MITMLLSEWIKDLKGVFCIGTHGSPNGKNKLIRKGIDLIDEDSWVKAIKEHEAL